SPLNKGGEGGCCLAERIWIVRGKRMKGEACYAKKSLYTLPGTIMSLS
ncbi:hypothetical protein HKBW3S42_01494, partial [Candidatus Hakubella thermalkaliphila]